MKVILQFNLHIKSFTYSTFYKFQKNKTSVVHLFKRELQKTKIIAYNNLFWKYKSLETKPWFFGMLFFVEIYLFIFWKTTLHSVISQTSKTWFLLAKWWDAWKDVRVCFMQEKNERWSTLKLLIKQHVFNTITK